MNDFDEAVLAIKQHSAAYQPVLRSWPAYLGDGEGTVIGSQANYYNCRYPTPESPSIEVYANGCPPNDGLRVMIGNTADQPDLIKIVSWNDSALDDTTNDHVKNHGDQHFYLGGDTVWVDWRQITTFRAEPYSGLTVYVRGGVLPRAGADIEVIPQIIDLTSSVPGSAGQARYALLSIDTTGAIVVTDGTIVTPAMALDASDVPSTPSGNFRVAAVALSYGQTNVTESLLQRDILDLRWPQESMAGIGVITPAMLANASAQYKYLVSGASPFAYAESAGGLNIASGKTLTVSNSLTLAGTDGFTLTVPATGTVALGAGTLTVATTNDVTGATHTHAITASADVSAGGTALLKSASGALTLAALTVKSGIAADLTLLVEQTNASYASYIRNKSASAYATNILETPTAIWSFGLNGGTAFRILDVTNTKYPFTIEANAPDNTIYANNAGRIGLGTYLPSSRLDLSVGNVDGVTVTSTNSGFLRIYSTDTVNANTRNWGIANLYNGVVFEILRSATRGGAATTSTIAINQDGWVSLNNSVPVSPFSVKNLSTTAGVIETSRLEFTGSGSDGDGGSILLLGRNSTTAGAAIARLAWSLPTAAVGSYKGRVSAYVSSAGGEWQWLQVDTDGTNADAKIGSATTYLDVVDNGDAFFVGAGSGIPYASVSISDNATATTIASASTYVQVAFDTDGVSNLATPDHTNDHITIVKTGTYRIEAHGDCHDGTVNNNYEIAVCINNGATVLNGGLRTHIFFDFATSEPQFGIEDHMALTAGDTVELWVKNNTAGNNITFEFVSLMLEMVGG